MSDPFSLVADGDIDALRRVLAQDPALARQRPASGASLLAWAAYTGRPDAVAAVRAVLVEVESCSASPRLVRPRSQVPHLARRVNLDVPEFPGYPFRQHARSSPRPLMAAASPPAVRRR